VYISTLIRWHANASVLLRHIAMTVQIVLAVPFLLCRKWNELREKNVLEIVRVLIFTATFFFF